MRWLLRKVEKISCETLFLSEKRALKEECDHASDFPPFLFKLNFAVKEVSFQGKFLASLDVNFKKPQIKLK